MDGQFHIKTAALPFDIDSLRVRIGHIPSPFDAMPQKVQPMARGPPERGELLGRTTVMVGLWSCQEMLIELVHSQVQQV